LLRFNFGFADQFGGTSGSSGPLIQSDFPSFLRAVKYLLMLNRGSVGMKQKPKRRSFDLEVFLTTVNGKADMALCLHDV
jgi:hypothetical protein